VPYFAEQFHNPAIYANQDTDFNNSYLTMQYAQRIIGGGKAL